MKEIDNKVLLYSPGKAIFNILWQNIMEKNIKKKSRTSLVVQWLGLCASSAEDVSLIPGWGTKIPHATWYGQKMGKKRI